MVTAAPGGEVVATASYYRPKTASNPAGRVSTTNLPPIGVPIKVIAAPDATIQCDESAVNLDARGVTAEIPVHPFFPDPGNVYGYPKRLYYSWTISGGVLKSNGGRSVMFDVTAKQGETVTLRCTVTNDAGTSVVGEKVFTLE